MPGGSRALPDRPNLRHLRLEAKRRLAASEFATLHDDIPAHAGAGLEGAASLAIRVRDNRTHLVLTSRLIPVNSIDAALPRARSNPPKE